MPPLPGEERLLTVFADIHYYFTAPTPKPLIHRFDKGSYLYLYCNASLRKTRIEVANNPGTPDQDAFNGALDTVHLRHSTRFPTLCTVTVDGQPQAQGFPPPPESTNSYEWQLPTNVQHSESHSQRLNTLDIYFWTQDDANQFLDLVERYLPHSQIETDRHPFPPQPQSNATSSIVQQLENVAITDPGYQNGQTRNSQSEVVANPASDALPPHPGSGPPPPLTQSATTASPSLSVDEKKDAAQFAPLPYNPAAPAEPEPIQHREKTPPPPDAADGTGLAAAVAADNGLPYSPPPHQFPGGGSYAPPQYSSTTQGTPYSIPGSYASPPPSAGLGSFPSQSSIHSPPGIPLYGPSYLAGGVAQQQQQPQQQTGHRGSLSFAPPPTDPNAHLYGGQSIFGSQAQAPPIIPPLGGFSNYSYDQAPKHQHQPGVGTEYDIHSQLYRPTEIEARSHHQKHAQQAAQNPQRGRKLEDSAARVETSVNRFLKRLEKRI